MTLVSKLNNVLNKKAVAALLVAVSMSAYSSASYAFLCKTVGGFQIGGGDRSVTVNLTPEVQPGQNIVVDLGREIVCWNEDPANFKDYVKATSSSNFSVGDPRLRGGLIWGGTSYLFGNTTSEIEFRNSVNNPRPLNAKVFVSPLGTNANGIAIEKDREFARVVMSKRTEYVSGGAPPGGQLQNFIWKLIAANDVIIPTSSCQINLTSPGLNVELDRYTGSNAPKPINLSVKCAQLQNLKYSLNGTTIPGSATIFKNTSAGGAEGVGIQLFDEKDEAISVGTSISLSSVGPSFRSLGLKANYAVTGEAITPGNVNSVISLTFTYN